MLGLLAENNAVRILHARAWAPMKGSNEKSGDKELHAEIKCEPTRQPLYSETLCPQYILDWCGPHHLPLKLHFAN
jgi:hypothetical protein